MRMRLALIDIVFALRIHKSVAYLWPTHQDLAFPFVLVLERRCLFTLALLTIFVAINLHTPSHIRVFPFFIWALQDDFQAALRSFSRERCRSYSCPALTLAQNEKSLNCCSIIWKHNVIAIFVFLRINNYEHYSYTYRYIQNLSSKVCLT